MSVPDPTAAIASYLAEEVGALVGGRVYRPTLSRRAEAAMPQSSLVVKAAGGYTRYGLGTGKVIDPRVDVICYGATRLEADALAREVAEALMGMAPHAREGVTLKTAAISGGPLPVVDPDTQWPYTLVSAQVTHARVGV